MCCSGFFEFCSGSDACAVLLRVWWLPLPEAPPECICNLWCSKPVWDLNHGRSCRNSCNTFAVSGLAAGFCLAAGFRCSPFPLHLNQRRCLPKPCNKKFFNELQWIFRVLFRFRCMCCSVACLVDTPFQSASRVHLHSAAFQTRQGSEPRAQSQKVLQRICCE